MSTTNLRRFWCCLSAGFFATSFLVARVSLADDANPPETKPAETKPAAEAKAEPEPEVSRLLGLSVEAPPEGDVEALEKYLDDLRLIRPRTVAQQTKLQTNAKLAADRLLGLIEDKSSEKYREYQQLSLTLLARLMGDYEPAEQAAAVAEIKRYVASQPELTSAELRLARSAAMSLEYADATDAAAAAYREFSEMFLKSDDEAVSRYGRMMEGAARRMGLLGKPMELTGTTLGGDRFDLTSLKGKVVLVDFWATWCGPCRAEHPNIAKNYERFRDRGFEVVGVSIDQDRQALESYVEAEKVTWITLHEEAAQGDNPATERYGIFGIPSMFLLDREGNVVSLRARGEELTAQLEKLLGDAPAPAGGN